MAHLFICPNCGNRTTSSERTAGFRREARGCNKCGFGFLFELLDDYYPAPATGFIVCDQDARVLATGRGVFELTGFMEEELMGRDVVDALQLSNGDPVQLVREWGVRKLGQQLAIRTRAGMEKNVTADFFPAYDEDGGLLVALTPRSH